MERLPFLSAALNIIAHWRSSHPPLLPRRRPRGGGGGGGGGRLSTQKEPLPPSQRRWADRGGSGGGLSLSFLFVAKASPPLPLRKCR